MHKRQTLKTHRCVARHLFWQAKDLQGIISMQKQAVMPLEHLATWAGQGFAGDNINAKAGCDALGALGDLGWAPFAALQQEEETKTAATFYCSFLSHVSMQGYQNWTEPAGPTGLAWAPEHSQGFAGDNINAKAGCDALGALGDLGWAPFAALQQEEETKTAATFYCSFLSHVSMQGYQNWTEPAGPTGLAWAPEHSQGFAGDNINAKAGCDALGALGDLGWAPFAALQQEEETKTAATFYCSFLSHVSMQGYQNWTEPAGPTGLAWAPEHSPIGVLVCCTSSFLTGQGFAGDNINAKAGCDALGALGDLGWSRIGAILRYQLPHYVISLLRLPFNSKGTICRSSTGGRNKDSCNLLLLFPFSCVDARLPELNRTAGPTGLAWDPEHSPIGVLVLNTLC
ncbi:hypothetical protein Cgig2_028112 [Carnegiea gigantea]|uniref:Uncharacterized protein n=1 Tax=Carnegiea gigantea TaxID=171969 RepID=A0A9Q1KK10_9CARY|nr:hypothetical protein Cgig2_028112 [Carnegiea gigantea]